LEGLDEGVIPIAPISQTMHITLSDGAGPGRSVHRRQYPMTLAYAFTDYRAQGQTLPAVLVDIAKVPNGRLTLFNVYVALSRSSGRDTIRLLRPFDREVFEQRHELELLEEDDRLENLDAATA
ncbi:hypothetical protein GGF50DRAFT_30903, partial [Schizophyllum commune]